MWKISMTTLLVWSFGAQARAASLVPPDLQKAILDELSGERAYDTVADLIRYDRVQASPGLAAAAAAIEQRLRSFGIDSHIETFPSVKRTWTWYAAPGWEATAATLRMVAPDQKKLADFSDLPLSLAKHSNSANITTSLVDVGDGLSPDDYKGKDVNGMIVLATGEDIRTIHRLACQERGAMGLVNAYRPDVHPGRPDIIRYTAFWPLDSEKASVRFCFNVSTTTALELRARLAHGEKITIEAKVAARFFDGTQPVVVARIPGSDAGEVIFTAHMCHPMPSANDNASGAAGLIEMARTVKALIDSKRIAQPRRSMRFVWIPEWYGMAPYMEAHPEIAHAVAAFNCDMIGESNAATGGYLSVTRTPDSLPSFLPALVENTLESIGGLGIVSPRGSSGRFMYSMDAYTGGSDHIFFDDSTMRVPSLMYSHWPDPFHHTAQDTLDKVDPTELKRSTYAALAPALLVASAGPAEAREIALDTLARARSRLAREVADAMLRIEMARDPQTLAVEAARSARVVRLGAVREQAAIMSAAALCGTPGGGCADIDDIARRIETTAKSLADEVRSSSGAAWRRRGWKQVPPKIPGEEDARKMVPARAASFVGPLDSSYLVEKLGAMPSLRLGDEPSYEMINFIDGRRSAFEIWEAVSIELDGVALADLLADLKTLSDAGLVELGSRR